MNTTYTVKHIQTGPTLFIDAVLCGGIICPANA